MGVTGPAQISVVVCTHNPLHEVLRRVIDALLLQSIGDATWELVVVDNGSSPAVPLELVRHAPRSRIVVESRAGLTSARLCGVRESTGNLIVFVDDDNVLSSDYLSRCLLISAEHPRLGAFGGRCIGEFETPPPTWLGPFLPNLAVWDFTEDTITTCPEAYSLIPCGAGLCIRRELAQLYAQRLTKLPELLTFDRVGSSTSSCGDWDLVLTGVDAGWSMGRFTSLHLTHIIPAARLTYDYNKKLAYGIGYSMGSLIAVRRSVSLREKIWRGLRTATSFLGLHGLGHHRGMDLSYQIGLFRGMCSNTKSAALDKASQ